MGVAGDMGGAPNSWPSAYDEIILYPLRVGVGYRSADAEGCLQRRKQSRIAEWLQQELCGSLFERSRADSLVLLTSDENDRDGVSMNLQFMLEIESSHTRHGDVED